MGMPSICRSIGSSFLSLLAALTHLSDVDGVSSRLKTLLMMFNPPNFSLHVFAAKNSLVRLLVRDCQCLPALRKSTSILPVFECYFFISNQSRSARPGLPVTPRYLYNETILSRFSFCLRRWGGVASVVAGAVNDASVSILLVSSVL